MTPDPNPEMSDLRLRAESRLSGIIPFSESPLPVYETQRQLYELQVHKIELELLNEELRNSLSREKVGQQSYRDLYDFVPVGYVTLTKIGVLIQANLEAASLLGLERGKIPGKRFAAFVAPNDSVEFATFMHFVFSDEARRVCEITLARNDHSLKSVRLEAVRSVDGAECRVVIMDVSEHRQAEVSLRNSESFRKEVLDAVSSHLCVLNANGDIVAVNQAWVDFSSDNCPKSSRLRCGIGINYLNICTAASGQNADEAAPMAVGIREVMAGARREFSIEYPCHSPTERRWFRARVTRFRDASGHVVITHEAITARKEAEHGMLEAQEQVSVVNRDKIQALRLQQELLKRADRLATLGVISASLVHDLNHSFNGISLAVGLLDQWAQALHPLLKRLAHQEPGLLVAGSSLDEIMTQMPMMTGGMQEAVRHVVSLHAHLRRYAKGMPTPPEKVDLGLLIDDAVALVQPYLDRALAKCSLHIPTRPLLLNTQRIGVEQVLTNLIINSAQALSGRGGTITISATAETSTGDVTLIVADNGPGMTPKQVDCLGHEFFTTHHDGSGLGWIIIRRVMDELGGSVEVQSSIEGGTLVRVVLPCTELVAP